MNTIKEYEHQIILNDWENFPYKLDYLIHLVCSHNEKVYDIFLKNFDGIYKVAPTTKMPKEDWKFDYNKILISKDELFDYLGIKNPASKAFSEFTYTTQIFDNPYKFNGQLYFNRSGNGLAFRVLEKPSNIHFNEKVNNYFLAHNLSQNLYNNPSEQKKLKI
jgi:hypothetical protein